MTRIYFNAALAASLCCGFVFAAEHAQIPNGPGKPVFERMCSRCHELSVVTSLRRTQPEWQATVNDMVRRGASGSDEDIQAVVAYLTAHFGRTAPVGERTSQPRRVIVVDPTAKQIPGNTDWSMFGHDPGAMRYSPLALITTANVKQLARVWTYHTGEPGGVFQMTPLVVNGTMYITTPSQKVVALEPETGRALWSYDPHVKHGRGGRGVSYWPGDGTIPPRILLPTLDGRLIALNAKTGKPAAGFGDNGELNLRTGFADNYPEAEYSVTSPPAIYKNLAIFGPALQEGPSHGPSGDPRAIDIRTGKLVWRFHVLPRPGEPGNDTWGPNGWKDRRRGDVAFAFNGRRRSDAVNEPVRVGDVPEQSRTWRPARYTGAGRCRIDGRGDWIRTALSMSIDLRCSCRVRPATQTAPTDQRPMVLSTRLRHSPAVGTRPPSRRRMHSAGG